MKTSVCVLINAWIIAFLLPIFTSVYGYSSNCTIFYFLIPIVSILVSSAFLSLTLSKHQVHVPQEEHPHEEDEHVLLSCDQKSPHQREAEVKKDFLDGGVPESYPENEVMGPFLSASEEDSDFDCACRSPNCSDGSISDEDSLIEIALPTGNYVGSKGCRKEEHEELCFQPLSPDISPESINRLSEEDNLIEIDISVGSIK